MTSRFLTNTWACQRRGRPSRRCPSPPRRLRRTRRRGRPVGSGPAGRNSHRSSVFTATPWFCSSKVFPSSPKASVRDEAASMVSVPPCFPPPPPDPPLSEPPPLPPPHDTSPSAIKKAHASNMGLDLIAYIINSPVSEIFVHQAPNSLVRAVHIRERQGRGLCATCTDMRTRAPFWCPMLTGSGRTLRPWGVSGGSSKDAPGPDGWHHVRQGKLSEKSKRGGRA